MTVNFRCLRELDNHELFENREHRARFSELVSCYCNYPFFNKGLCKCMYLSSWDMEHFIIMLDILNDLTLERSRDVEPMKDNGKSLEDAAEGYERHILRLASAFLNNEAFEIPDEPIAAEGLYIMKRALAAAQVIDQVFASPDTWDNDDE